jgi:tRNA(Ile)-lysidine synthase
MPSQSDLYARWSREVRRAGLFRAGDRVGVAVSGGADSVLLLDFLRQLAPALGVQISVVHFNHRLRGAESDADEAFVRSLAERLKLEFHGSEADVARLARGRRRNLEATARELRYRFFFSLVAPVCAGRRGKLDRVATAHTANDQAETVLLRLLRGAGARGLGGIFPVLEGKIVRPFLNVTRREIEAEIRRRGLQFREDSSNRDARLRRNRIRHELLPLLERAYNPEVVRLLKTLADRARDDEEFLEHQARERAAAWRVRDGIEERIPARVLAEFPPALARRVLRQMVWSAQGHVRGLTHAHLESLRRFAAEAQSGRSLVLPGPLAARKEFEWLALAPAPARSSSAGYSLPVRIPGRVAVPELGSTFQFKILGPEALRTAYNDSEMAGLDPQKLAGRLILRNWRPGDRFRPLGSRKSLKVKELFQLHKIPLERRRVWPVLERDGEIVWVRGFPVGENARASGASAGAVVITEVPSAARGA